MRPIGSRFQISFDQDYSMPGIAGCITRLPRAFAEVQVKRMTNAMIHDRSCRAGVWSDERLGVYVGWVAREGSFADAMPVQNERRDAVLVFSGEEFPSPDTAQRLRAQGHAFEASGPAYLVHLYEEDPSFPACLNGRFHGLLVDRKDGRAVLFNDRYGMHRIYYHESQDAFYFAAEAKAILAVCPELRRLDYRSVGEFVSCGAVLENRTIFDGIEVLPPGSAWSSRAGAIEKKYSYFHSKEWEEQEVLDSESYYRELRSAFTQNLPRYFAGPEPVGMSLTGGLDTRMILASRQAEPAALPCYTYGSIFRENEDVRIARRVAEVYSQPFEVLTAGDEFLSRFADYAERTVYLTDGCVDVARAADLYLSEKAREIAPVRMTGLYGGELLRGFRAFKPGTPAEGLYCGEFLSYVDRAATTYRAQLQCHPISFAAFKQGPWYLYGALSLEQSQLSVRTPYLDNDFVRTVFRGPVQAFSDSELCLALIEDGNAALRKIPTDRGIGGSRRTVLQAAAHGLLEFFFKAEYAYDMGMPHWLAKLDHAFSPLKLERLFLGRHKPFHFRVWYRDTLAEYVQELFHDERTLSRPHVERKGVETMVRGHLKGNRNYTLEIHKLITLELIHRLFCDGSGAGADSTDNQQLVAQTYPELAVN
jgi:asparagine synthase (glutamine-hydrolysing)